MAVIDLYYEIHGSPSPSQPPLLLIHGGGSNITTNWASILPLLAADRRVIAVETQGHGHTPSTGRPYTFENTAADVAALLERLGVASVDVLGFSNGGSAAMRLAMHYPRLVRRLIVASAFYRREGMIDGFWEGLEAADIASLPEPYAAADRKINPDPQHQQLLFDLDRNNMLNFVDWEPDELRAMDTPTLFVAGDRDVIKVEHTVEMASLVPGARLLILPSTHGAYLGELLAADDLSSMHATLPWLLSFLSETRS